MVRKCICSSTCSKMTFSRYAIGHYPNRSSITKKVWRRNSRRQKASERMSGRKNPACLEKNKIKIRTGIARALQDPEVLARRKAAANRPSRVTKISKSSQEMWDEHPERRKIYAKIAAERNTKIARPNGREKFLEKLLNKLFPSKFFLNVKDGLIIGTKVPDFIGVGRKKVLVELFGDYWHGEKITGRKRRQEERCRVAYFSKFGFRTAIIWEKDLKDEMLVKKKIRAVLV